LPDGTDTAVITFHNGADPITLTGLGAGDHEHHVDLTLPAGPLLALIGTVTVGGQAPFTPDEQVWVTIEAYSVVEGLPPQIEGEGGETGPGGWLRLATLYPELDYSNPDGSMQLTVALPPGTTHANLFLEARTASGWSSHEQTLPITEHQPPTSLTVTL
ncbi:MAG TPA: hypothetical protein PLV68_17120, partial [Ilumatobacteraceae bacterium]|nr:hypothetical protein [Ilumatobacteraceae bacterium]